MWAKNWPNVLRTRRTGRQRAENDPSMYGSNHIPALLLRATTTGDEAAWLLGARPRTNLAGWSLVQELLRSDLVIRKVVRASVHPAPSGQHAQEIRGEEKQQVELGKIVLYPEESSCSAEYILRSEER